MGQNMPPRANNNSFPWAFFTSASKTQEGQAGGS
jgi:hypothetical protein